MRVKASLGDTQSSLTVSGKAIGQAYSFSETKTFEYKANGYVTFVETDKPVYKPGQTGSAPCPSVLSHFLI
jgi:hypothetical protein